MISLFRKFKFRNQWMKLVGCRGNYTKLMENRQFEKFQYRILMFNFWRNFMWKTVQRKRCALDFWREKLDNLENCYIKNVYQISIIFIIWNKKRWRELLKYFKRILKNQNWIMSENTMINKICIADFVNYRIFRHKMFDIKWKDRRIFRVTFTSRNKLRWYKMQFEGCGVGRFVDIFSRLSRILAYIFKRIEPVRW